MPVRARRKRSSRFELWVEDELALTLGPRDDADEAELRRLREVYRRHWGRIDVLGADGKPTGRPSWAFSRFVDDVETRESAEDPHEGLSGRDLDVAVGLPIVK